MMETAVRSCERCLLSFISNFLHVFKPGVSNFMPLKILPCRLIEFFLEATRISPKYFEAYHNLGQVLQDMQRYQEAITYFKIEAKIRPDISAPLLAVASCYNHLNEREKAAKFAVKATKLDPTNTAAWNGAGWFLHLAGRSRDSERVLKKGIRLHPSLRLIRFEAFSDPLQRKGFVGPSRLGCCRNISGQKYSNLKLNIKASMLLKSIKLENNNPESKLANNTCVNTPNCWEWSTFPVRTVTQSRSGIKNETSAVWKLCKRYLQEALNDGLTGNNALIAMNHIAHASWQVFMLRVFQVRRLQLQMIVCNFTNIEEGRREILRLVSEQMLNIGTPLDRLFFYRKFTLDKQLAATRMVESTLGSRNGERIRDLETFAIRKLKIGFLSADFRSHPMGYIMSDFFKAARSEMTWLQDFQVFAISLTQDVDHVAREVEQTVDVFLRVGHLDDERAAIEIQQLRLDLVIELGGHTRGSRFRLLALDLAPVVMHFQGFADTMGSDSVRYMLADKVVAPPELRSLYSEHLVYLSPSYHFYAPELNCFSDWNADAPRRSSEREFPLFDSQVSPDRIEEHMWLAWTRILRTSQGSIRLRQGQNSHEEHELLEANLKAAAARAGLSASSLVFVRQIPSKEAHLHRLASADLFLDTDSYSAHSTALDALWAGLPVLTFPRESFSSRPPSSFLLALGVGELVARGLGEYEAMAKSLANSTGVMQRWREKVWARRMQSTFFDSRKKLRQMRAAFRMTWEIGEDMHIVVSENI
ncbi:hypothetical protein GUITHDRAFT_166087 [Guillardia theta CCMP2712]|uniref:protein O-GlcNAc transferase n=1 Tax=Guillardia theta (strain CCMP2712) TaxID=905079 RepID=L1IGY1_GUITC|nr:hypothetical protein GUITHDRAFT_166087 [Guillardia theta CCMP2712]EKX35090.1 hypothetical protein GUITHDRAFT_166087 [Guillardia theta CCMP2712]|eukprot:XP_005822070.1 hypothetical protein GUITHDRAFT_166087 [Guillardia theta CCMP2712]